MGQSLSQSGFRLPSCGTHIPYHKSGFDKFCDIASTIFLVVAPIFLVVSCIILAGLVYSVKKEMRQNHEAEIQMWLDPAYYDNERPYRGNSDLTPYHRPRHH